MRPVRPLRALAALAVLGSALPLAGWAQLTLGDEGDLPLRWSEGYTIPYHVHSDGYSGLSLVRVRGAIDRAFATWELPCTTLRSASDPNLRDGDTPAMDGQSIIRFEERALPPEIDPESVLAFTSHVGVFCTGVVTEADITFNAVGFEWSDGNGGERADIETVALHEIGHLLGLGHSDFDWAVMYPSIVDRLRRDLSRDEEDGLCGIYTAESGAACRRDADCAGGEVCMIAPTSDEQMVSQCGSALGGRRAGQACAADAEFCDSGCASGLCLADGTCSTLCRADADCPRGWLCFPDTLQDGSDSGYCVNLTLCEDDVGACPAGDVCTVTERPEGDALFRICIEADGVGEVGDRCRTSDACVTGLCVFGACSAPCDADADCPAPFACLSAVFGLTNGEDAETSLCLVDDHPCQRGADCQAGLACVFERGDDGVTSRCAIPTGMGRSGEACEDARGCESAACIGGECTAPCLRDTDCPEGWICDRTPVFGSPTDACVPEGAPRPDGGVVEPDPQDGSIAPGADADTLRADAREPTSPPGDGGPDPTHPDVARPVASSDVAVSEADQGVLADDGGGVPPAGGVTRRESDGGGSTGCQATPGRLHGSSLVWGLFPVAFSRRRRRTA